MACSDNVVRAGLTPKFRDKDTLCEMLTYNMQSAQENKFSPQKHPTVPNALVYDPPTPEFAVVKIAIPCGTKELCIPSTEGVLCVWGGGGVLSEWLCTCTGGCMQGEGGLCVCVCVCVYVYVYMYCKEGVGGMWGLYSPGIFHP